MSKDGGYFKAGVGRIVCNTENGYLVVDVGDGAQMSCPTGLLEWSLRYTKDENLPCAAAGVVGIFLLPDRCRKRDGASAYRREGMQMKDKTIPVGGIWLRRIGDRVIVAAEINGRWIDVISEHAEGSFSHIVEPSGMLKCEAEGKLTDKALSE